MSFFRVILVVLYGFGPSPLLMGMEKEQKVTTFKYSNPYFDSELQKILLLLMQKNKYPNELALERDIVGEIAKKNYDLHCNQLFNVHQELQPYYYREAKSFEEHWKLQFRLLSNEKIMGLFSGEKIEVNDFDFITMNAEGRDKFNHSIRAVLANLTRKTVCRMFTKPVDDYYVIDGCSRNELWILVELSDSGSYGYTSLDVYNDILNLPESLRSKVGNLCMMTVVSDLDSDATTILPSHAKILNYDRLERDGILQPLVPYKSEDFFIKAIALQKLEKLSLPLNELKQSVQLDHFNLRNRA